MKLWTFRLLWLESTTCSNQDTLTGPKGGRIRGSPLYTSKRLSSIQNVLSTIFSWNTRRSLQVRHLHIQWPESRWSMIVHRLSRNEESLIICCSKTWKSTTSKCKNRPNWRCNSKSEAMLRGGVVLRTCKFSLTRLIDGNAKKGFFLSLY